MTVGQSITNILSLKITGRKYEEGIAAYLSTGILHFLYFDGMLMNGRKTQESVQD